MTVKSFTRQRRERICIKNSLWISIWWPAGTCKDAATMKNLYKVLRGGRGKSVRGGGKVKSQCRCISACNKQLFLYSTLNNTAKICFLNVCICNGKRNKMYENNMIFSWIVLNCFLCYNKTQKQTRGRSIQFEHEIKLIFTQFK